MRLAVKTGWLCGTGVFLLLTYTSVFRQIDLVDVMRGNQMTMEPVTALLICLSGGVMAGMVGFLIGDIFARPRGSAPAKKGRRGKQTKGQQEPSAPITGDETFLDDLDLDLQSPETRASNPSEPDPEAPGADDGLSENPISAPPLPEEQKSR